MVEGSMRDNDLAFKSNNQTDHREKLELIVRLWRVLEQPQL